MKGKFMQLKDITADWLKNQKFKIEKGVTIKGVTVKDLTVNLDGRGEVTELWSSSWVGENGIAMAKHVYQSSTDFGVVKCWHAHQIHTDQSVVTRGKIQIGLVDIRPDSPTFLHVNSVFMGELRPRLVVIPPGIMHGWKSLSEPEVRVTNFQTEIFDPKDEIRFDWDTVLTEIWEPKNG